MRNLFCKMVFPNTLEDNTVQVETPQKVKLVWPWSIKDSLSEGLYTVATSLVNIRLDLVWQGHVPSYWTNPRGWSRSVRRFVKKQVETCQDQDRRTFYQYLKNNMESILDNAREWDLGDYEVEDWRGITL